MDNVSTGDFYLVEFLEKTVVITDPALSLFVLELHICLLYV